MAPVSSATATPSDSGIVNVDSIHTTMEKFREQSPQLFWLVICVFTFSFGLSAIYICYKIVMLIWKGPTWTDDPRLIPPPKDLARTYSSRLPSRSNTTLSRADTARFKRQLLEQDRKLDLIATAAEKPATMTRRSWTRSLLARASPRGSTLEIWLGDHLETSKDLGGTATTSSSFSSLSEKQDLAAPAPCLVKGTGLACPPPKAVVQSANTEAPVDSKRLSDASEASVYSQESATSTLAERTHGSPPREPDDSVPSIIVQSPDTPARTYALPALSAPPTPRTPDSPTPAPRRASTQDLLQVPVRTPGASRARPRPPSFASSRGTSHVTGRRFALAPPPPPSRRTAAGRAAGKENAGRHTGERAKAGAPAPAPTRAPLANKGSMKGTAPSSAWRF